MRRRDIVILIESVIKNNPKQKVHIILNNKKFYNGEILNYDNEDTISFFDDKIGYLNIFYSQILNVEPFIEK